MDTHCTATTKAGTPCAATHYRDGWCRWHHPELADQRDRARRAGGHAKSNRARARKQLETSKLTPRELDGLLCSTMVNVATGKTRPGVGAALGTLARAVIAVREHLDVEERLAALEAELGRRHR